MRISKARLVQPMSSSESVWVPSARWCTAPH